MDGIDALLETHPGLRRVPTADDSAKIIGRFRFTADAPGLEVIEDNYLLEIVVPAWFPKAVPLVREIGGRIPSDWHRNPSGALCLGSPTEVKLKAAECGTLGKFLELLVVPFLYGRSFYERHHEMPFGELDHGVDGVLKDFRSRFGVAEDKAAMAMVILAGLRKRVANKRPCPCGGGKRLGRCSHHGKVNALRKILGRAWFRSQLKQIQEWLRRAHPKTPD